LAKAVDAPIIIRYSSLSPLHASADDSTMTATAPDKESTLSARLKFLTVAGVGLFADGYLNISIGLGR
jgi:hypothetical protein